MVGRNKQPKYNINKNVLVIGGSGSGKTRFHIKPNLMQMNASFIVTDPKGTVIEECGKMLVEGGYKIKVLNLIDFSQSMKYNPFRYLHSENDILKLVNCIMENTKGEGTSGGEDFWQKAEALYYQALIAYIWYEARPEEKNMNTLLAMLNASEVREEDETFENAVDKLFRELEQKNPEHFAVRQYKKYKLAAGEDGKEFFTITTADNNVFYLIVDRQREEENVYFLNAVTETDLLSLAQADDQPELILEPEEEPTCNCTQKCEAGDVNTLCPVCKENRKACVGEVPEEPEPEAKESNAGLILFVVLILAVGGAVGWYLKIYRPKQEFMEDDDSEEEESEEFGTETINEDEEENQPEETTEDVAYYDDYPDEEPLEK